MVKARILSAVAFLGLLGCVRAIAGEFELRAVFSRPKIYFGETATVQFVLYGTDLVAEVEVAKFPEFRGYWSENQALRQGPIALSDSDRSGMRMAVIGAYSITPMLGRKPQIAPMRVMIRRPGASVAGGESLESVLPPLAIEPLPPVPQQMQPYFTGAVGRFQTETDTPAVLYTEGEPALVRWAIQGEGNFSEINRVNWDVPGIRVLDTRAFAQGTSQFGVKVFEMRVVVEDNAVTKLPGLRFAFFDPLLRRYELAEARSVELQVQPQVASASSPTESLAPRLGALESRMVVRPSLLRSPYFWGVQAVVGLVGLLGIGFRRWRRRPKAVSGFAVWPDILALPDGMDLLRRGSDAVRGILQIELGIQGLSSNELLRKAAEMQFAPERMEAAGIVFQLYAKAYSGAPLSASDFQAFRTALRAIQTVRRR